MNDEALEAYLAGILNKYGVLCGPSIAEHGDKLVYGDEFMVAAREIYSAGAEEMRERAVEVIEFLRTSCEDRESCHSDDIEAIQSLPIGESSQAPQEKP